MDKNYQPMTEHDKELMREISRITMRGTYKIAIVTLLVSLIIVWVLMADYTPFGIFDHGVPQNILATILSLSIVLFFMICSSAVTDYKRCNKKEKYVFEGGVIEKDNCNGDGSNWLFDIAGSGEVDAIFYAPPTKLTTIHDKFNTINIGDRVYAETTDKYDGYILHIEKLK